jgi:conjugal transfer pilus assembly protein TraW
MSTKLTAPFLWLAAGSVLTFSATAHAEDLGKKGPTYQVDPDAREEFKEIVRRKQQSGELAAFWKSYRDKTIASIKHPPPLDVKSDYRPRREYRDVRFVIPSDYRDERGNVIVRRGTVVEPLRIQPLTGGLVFVDGRDPAQVDYAIARGRAAPLKIVLTAGSAYDLRVKFQHTAWRGGEGIPFYFDQRKMIINSLKMLYDVDVGSVPAVMTQTGTGVTLEFGMGDAK